MSCPGKSPDGNEISHHSLLRLFLIVESAPGEESRGQRSGSSPPLNRPQEKRAAPCFGFPVLSSTTGRSGSEDPETTSLLHNLGSQFLTCSRLVHASFWVSPWKIRHLFETRCLDR